MDSVILKGLSCLPLMENMILAVRFLHNSSLPIFILYDIQILMNSFYLYIQSRSVDKQHAVISVNLENAEYKLHDLGTLNGVSMSTPWNAIEDPIKSEVLKSCVISDSLPCAITKATDWYQFARCTGHPDSFCV